jgi:tRNA(fMet)-specific endonuclease VapC
MVADRASTIYSDLASRGELIGDADMLIAATALVYKMGLVTNNHKHFSRIAGLEIERWTE